MIHEQVPPMSEEARKECLRVLERNLRKVGQISPSRLRAAVRGFCVPGHELSDACQLAQRIAEKREDPGGLVMNANFEPPCAGFRDAEDVRDFLDKISQECQQSTDDLSRGIGLEQVFGTTAIVVTGDSSGDDNCTIPHSPYGL